jgi:hypothetical protein
VGPEFLLSWQAFLALVLLMLLALGVIFVVAGPRFQQVGWLKLIEGYLFALLALTATGFVQVGFDGAKLLTHSLLSSYIVLPWITLFAFPAILWQRNAARAIAIIISIAVLLTAGVTALLWPRAEGFDISLVVENQVVSASSFFMMLTLTALAFYLGSRPKQTH